MDFDLSMVSEDFQCYNTSEAKPVHTDEPKETNLTLEPGIKSNILYDEPRQTVRKSKRIPYANQTEKLGGNPYYTNNNKKKFHMYHFT